MMIRESLLHPWDSPVCFFHLCLSICLSFSLSLRLSRAIIFLGFSELEKVRLLWNIIAYNNDGTRSRIRRLLTVQVVRGFRISNWTLIDFESQQIFQRGCLLIEQNWLARGYPRFGNSSFEIQWSICRIESNMYIMRLYLILIVVI